MEEAPPQAPPRRRVTPPSQINLSDSNAGVAGTSQSTESQEWEIFQKLHVQAYQETSEAIKLDGQNHRELAFNAYQKCLQLIDKALEIAYKGPFSEEYLGRIDEAVYKMRLTRKEILERVSDLQSTPESGSEDYLQGPSTAPPQSSRPSALNLTRRGDEAPPAYTQLLSPGEQSLSSYSQLNSVLNELATNEENLVNPLPINGTEVFNISSNVQIYFISTDENVSAPSYPSFLRIVSIARDVTDQASALGAFVPAFLQVGEWTYPLIPGKTPIFKAADGTFIFPDLTPGHEGSTVGLILPIGIPEEDRETLDQILLQLTGLVQFLSDVQKEKPPRPPLPKSPQEVEGTRFGTKIAQGAEAVSKGLVVGAEKTAHYLDVGAGYVMGKLEPTSESPNISPGVKRGLKTAKNVTGKAVQISSFLVTQLGNATLAVGHRLAPHIQKHGTKLIAKTTKKGEAEAAVQVEQVLEVTSGAVQGFSTIYGGLEHAAKVLANSLSNNTVQIVGHKYGDEAGAVAGDAAETVGNTLMTGLNARCLGPKALAKRVAKDTGKAVLKGKHEDKSHKSPEEKEKK